MNALQIVNFKLYFCTLMYFIIYEVYLKKFKEKTA